VSQHRYARIVDPLASIILGPGEGRAIDPRRLTPAGVRASFGVKTDWVPEMSDEQRDRWDGLTEFTEMRPAAVLIPLVERDHGLSLLLTQRTAHLSAHGGQISFPGGRVEKHDSSPVDTALRETEEEIGLARRHIETVGSLPDYLTTSGFRVTPVVSLIRPPFDLKRDEGEVAEIFEVPLVHLMDPGNHQTRSIDLETGTRTFYSMPYDRHFIWGATAGMLRNFYSFLNVHLPHP
jgi:8-oxo-dGTP pyrophosphatase MutT (NUDIX family)